MYGFNYQLSYYPVKGRNLDRFGRTLVSDYGAILETQNSVTLKTFM